MSIPLDPENQRRITDATEAITVAQRELELALSEVSGDLRANKQMISQALQTAFDKLAAARLLLQSILSG